MSVKITEVEIQTANDVAARIKADIDEARKYPNCEALVSMLEERHAPMADVIANAGHRNELRHLAWGRVSEAKKALDDANSVPCSLDREAALRRRDDVECAQQAVIVREAEARRAVDDAIEPLKPVMRHKRNAHREAASELARSMAEFCVRSDGTPPQPDPAKTPPEQVLWEAFFFARELENYVQRKPYPLRFADDAGVARAVDHLRKAFDTRTLERTRRVEDTQEKARGAKERTAKARADNHGITAMEERVAKLGLNEEQKPNFRNVDEAEHG